MQPPCMYILKSGTFLGSIAVLNTLFSNWCHCMLNVVCAQLERKSNTVPAYVRDDIMNVACISASRGLQLQMKSNIFFNSNLYQWSFCRENRLLPLFFKYGDCKCGHTLSDSPLVKAAGVNRALTELAQVAASVVSKLTRSQFPVLLPTIISNS